MPASSQGKNKAARSRGNASQDESSSSSTNIPSSPDKISKKQFERKVNEMIRYILFHDRKMVGIKRPDLVKNVLKEHSKIFTAVMKEVSKKLGIIFGFELVEMENEDGKSKGYILINKLDINLEEDILSSSDVDEENSKTGLLLVILSVIFMNDGLISEISLWHTLAKFGLYKDRFHEVFGNLDKLINQEFIKHNHLERQKIQGHEGPTFQYICGSRSVKEISKRRILEFVSEVYGIESIKDWKIQYQQVLDLEKKEIQAVT